MAAMSAAGSALDDVAGGSQHATPPPAKAAVPKKKALARKVPSATEEGEWYMR